MIYDLTAIQLLLPQNIVQGILCFLQVVLSIASVHAQLCSVPKKPIYKYNFGNLLTIVMLYSINYLHPHSLPVKV